MRNARVFAWGLLLLSAGSMYHLAAQELTGRIRGEVTDPSGAMIPGAEVKATNTGTGVTTTVMTAPDGTFQFLSLPAGNYDVTITKDRFRTFVARNIPLRLNQVYDLTASLELGSTSQTIQVEGEVTQVETTSTQMSTVFESQKITDFPLLNRSWVQLEQLVPGVVSSSDRFGAGYSYSTNGSESQQNSYMINGADSMDLRLNQPLIIPSLDSIAEFTLIDSTMNAEYGRNSGGILHAVLKSGTKQLHGTVFEFYRDTFLNTHNFFQKTAPVFHQNQFGGVLSGPVWKQHTFFMISYQATRNRAPDSNFTTYPTVFTQDQRNGIFPGIATSKTTSPTPLVGESGATFPAGTAYDVLFPTGHIPAKDLNPLSLSLMNKYVLPANNGTQYVFNPVQTQDQEQGIARLDHHFSDRDSMWVSLFFQHDPRIHDLSFLGGTLPGFGEGDIAAEKQYIASWNHIFGPTMVNELRLSFIRFNYGAVTPLNPVLPSSLGFTGINPQFPGTAGAPYISITGYFNLGFSPYGPQPVINNTYQIDDNFSKVIGNHTLKFGYDGRRYQVYNSYQAFNNGFYTFGGAGTYSTGDSGADFLLGFPDSYLQESGGVQDYRTMETYLYLQDSWKARRNLTLNLGLGYQIDTPLENHLFNKLDNNCFRPGQQSTIFPTAPVGLVFPGDKGCSVSGYYNHYDHFGPRVGFAYSPDSKLLGGPGKFVIRGGFGVYFNRTEEELALQNLGAAPFSIAAFGASAINGNPSFANPYADLATGKLAPNLFPFVPPPAGSKADFSQFEPLSINVTDPNFTSPYSMNFNLNVQRELPSNVLLQVGYVGAQGRHLELIYEGNPISPAGSAACALDPSCISSRAIQHINYPSHAQFAPGDIFGSVGTQATRGVSSYNSLQVSVNKRLSHGLELLAAYTWSHSIDDTSGYEGSGAAPGLGRALNPFNFGLDRGDSTFDARHRLVLSYDYQIPRLSSRWNNVFSRYALDGWRVGGGTSFQTGFPITVGDSGFRSLSCDSLVYYACWDTPNVSGSPVTGDPRNNVLVNTAKTPANTKSLANYYFNPNIFSLEKYGIRGTEGRNNFHGPGLNNTDLVLAKQVNFTETRKLELRLEGFNVFNHTQFRFSNSILSFQDINSGNFGRSLVAAPGRLVQLGAKIYF